MMSLRLAFMGTPDFAVAPLEALIAHGHRIAAIYTQPPRPAGRGHQPALSPVHEAGLAHGIPVHTPLRFDEAVLADFRALDLDAAVVAAYGLILPKPALSAPRLGCINIHASLLPRWRGAAPIERAILAGDTLTGITIMAMEEGLDTGPILLARSLEIGEKTTAGALHDRLSRMGAALILEALQGPLHLIPQEARGATYAKKLRREEGALDWRQSAAMLERKVRALNPRPGTWFEHGGERIKVLEAAVIKGVRGAAGTVLDEALTIACGEEGFRPLRLQRPGRAVQATDAFMRGYGIAAGTMLPCPVTS
ncbi:MAG TPA: methionyl-tRNA formyltransferase [Stellaceae bacterium]|nr:methionyl-tRNA formyltransferase [Stellaceae bacterium]